MEVASAIKLDNTDAPAKSRSRRKRSLVWNHFTIDETADGCARARCNLCKQTFAYCSNSKILGTSHLKRHIDCGSCPVIKNQEKTQFALHASQTDENINKPPKRRRGASYASLPFDQDTCCSKLAKMIILHEYPHNMVEHHGFISFVKSLQPLFKTPSIGDIEREILVIYQKEKQNLMYVVGATSGRISLTMDLWSTSRTYGYLCLTGYFIDNEWRLQRRVLGFQMVSSPDSEGDLSEAIGTCLSNWDLKTKIFGITLASNCFSHDIYSENLRGHLMSQNTLMLKGQLFVVRCYAQILKTLAQDAIASINQIVYKIREILKFVKLTPSCEEQFFQIAIQLGILSMRPLYLDVATEWNTTYLMLDMALEYKEAFSYLETCDNNSNEAPSVEEWRRVEIVFTFLKLLYDSTNTIGSMANPTANMFFEEAWRIQLELANHTKNIDDMVSSTAKMMHEKFDKYWIDCRLLLAIAAVMDPQFKLKLVEFSFSQMYGQDSARYIKEVSDRIYELYLEYVLQPIDQGEANINFCNNNDLDGVFSPSMDLIQQHTKSELDEYLEEPLVPRMPEFDVLNWWNINNFKYPTLCRMARDILAIPMFMVNSSSSEFALGMGRQVLDEYWSSLRPEIVEALFCTKDWLQFCPVDTELPSTAIVKVELVEDSSQSQEFNL